MLLIYAIAFVIVSACISAVIHVTLQKAMTNNNTNNNNNNKSSKEVFGESLRVTDQEAQFLKMKIPYTCSITWMRGDYESAKIHLQKRLEIMVQKNPWLLGRIQSNYNSKQGSGSCHLMYSKLKDNNSDESTKLLLVGHGEETLNTISPTSSPISRQTPLSKLSDIIREAGFLIENGPHEPIFKVSIIPCFENPKESFALLVQLSHVAGDGATYYKLFNMLCSLDDTSITAMIPERITDSEKLQMEVLGKEESGYFSSGGNAIRIVRGTLSSIMRGKTTQVHYGWVDESKMKLIKEKAAKEAGIPFVSTNDVITSWFMNEAKHPTGVMAINMRGRLNGHTDLHAGNYESMMFYNKQDFATPALIRQSLTKYKRVVTGDEDMAPWYKVATTSVTVVTNWATFGKPIQVEGCVEDIHFPVPPGSNWPTTLTYLIIFRASAGRIGLAYVDGNEGANLLDNASFVEKMEVNNNNY